MLLFIGSCVFGGSDDPKPAPTPSPTAVAASIEGPPAVISASAEKNGKALLGEDTGPVNIGDMDDADRAIRLAINTAGHLCAKPILILPTALDTKYDVTCITNRSGKGRSRYIVDSQTERVVQIR